MSKNRRNWKEKVFLITLLLLAVSMPHIIGAPGGPDLEYITTEEVIPQSATNITTKGGTITTIVLNATTQNPHWKAYVGNVTGRLALRDSNNYTIYDWALTIMEGEVYATRNTSVIWAAISCADAGEVSAEETAMNHTASKPDSISNTFDTGTHDAFFVGAVEFSANECAFTTNTYVNSTSQNRVFDEILLHDGNAIVYATMINDSSWGYDYQLYDFQMIIAEKGIDPVSTTPYYFYVELV